MDLPDSLVSVDNKNILSDFNDAKDCSPPIFESFKIFSFLVIVTTGGDT